MTTKQEADLYEMTHPNYDRPYDDYPYGSDQDGASWDQDEIELHNKNFAECIELDQIRSLSEAFPDNYSDPCGGRACDECEIGGCDHGIISELDPVLRVRMEQNALTVDGVK